MNTHKLSMITTMSLLATSFAATGFHVSGKKLLDANENEFLMRGINFPYAWYVGQWSTSVAPMEAAGANAVRVVLATGDQWTRTSGAELTTIINDLKAHNMIAVLEVHDCTGYGDTQYAPNAVPLTKATDYWTQTDIMDALKGQEAYVILNIANEPIGNTAASTYVDATKNAISALRTAGYKHTIMADAPNWGQDHTGTMRTNAASILASDPENNVIFSVHMYEVYTTATKIETYVKYFSDANLPLVVGEFATENNGNAVDAVDVLKFTVQYGYGYIGWSWKGNSSGLTNLDIALDWTGTQLSSWGDLLINSANGLKAQSEVASVFTNPPSAVNAATTPMSGLRLGVKGAVVDISSSLSDEIDWSVNSLQGKRVSAGKIDASQQVSHQVNLETLPGGFYIFQVESGSHKSSIPIHIGD